MAVAVKSSQSEEAELICGVSSDCVMLQPAKLEPEPLNFISVNNGVYATATTSLSELYNCQSVEPTYQQLTSYQPFPADIQEPKEEFLEDHNQNGLTSEGEFIQTQNVQEEVYTETDELPRSETVYTKEENELSEHSSSTLSVPMQDYYEIQVAEEEVVCDNWNVAQNEVIVEDSKPQLEANKSAEDIEIPLPQDQDIYSQMHPYPCDFCSRRFSKKSTLMSHMISHQTERPHGCNLCGARYRRKSDLVNHLKIHAYPPPRTTLDDDDDDLRGGDGKGRRKKAQSLAPKKNSFGSDLSTSDTMEFKEVEKKSLKKWMRKGKNHPSKSVSYVDEDMRLLSEMSRNSDIVKQVPRWPIIDQSRPYVCQHCGVGFAREKALASHSRIHGGDSPFECDVCSEMFWDLSLLREHARIKHPQHDVNPSRRAAPGTVYTGDDRFGTFICETCGVSFHRMDLLKKHRRSHLKIEPMQEVGDDDHVCTVCGQFFENASELRSHAESHVQETHRCAVCGLRFDDSAELSEHVLTNHRVVPKREPPSSCSLCGKVCKDQRALAKHVCVDPDSRSFSCFSCNKRFHSRARLRRHMVSHRDKAVSCSDCGEEFPDGRALMSHRHSHNAGSTHGARSFPCHDCGKTFGSRSSQQIHVRIHTGERPYGCRFCWKAFADGGTLRKHERIHTGEKPYVCPVCPKAFNQRVVLREHIRAHHSGSDSKVNSCYECKVCGYLFSSSSELCVHLVQHSDENTAKHRLPSMGPRKYKRRRKPDAPSPSPSKTSPGLDYSTDSSDSMIGKSKKIIKKKYSYDDSPSRSNDLGNSVVESFENAIDNISSIMMKSEQQKKKKLDKEMKKHKTKALSKLTKLARIEKRAKAAKLLNNTSYASKYVVSRPDDRGLEGQIRPRTKNVTYPMLEDTLDTILNGTDSMRNRPRTKNVNYHNMKVTKLEPATFPLSKKEKREKKNRVKRPYTKKEKTKPLPAGVFNGSNQNEMEESTAVSEEKLETCIVDDFNIEGVHNLIKPEELQQIQMNRSAVESILIKHEPMSCEMCGDEFNDRAELLAHIRVHI